MSAIGKVHDTTAAASRYHDGVEVPGGRRRAQAQQQPPDERLRGVGDPLGRHPVGEAREGLIAQGADPTPRDKAGKTAFDLAANEAARQALAQP